MPARACSTESRKSASDAERQRLERAALDVRTASASSVPRPARSGNSGMRSKKVDRFGGRVARATRLRVGRRLELLHAPPERRQRKPGDSVDDAIEFKSPGG